MAKTDEVLCLKLSYLLFRRAGSGVYASGIYLYVYLRGAEQLGFIAIIIIIATIYRGRIVLRAGEMVTMIELCYCPAGWPMMLACAAGPWAHLGLRRCPILAIRWLTRVASGRGVWPVAGRVNPFMR